MNAKQANSIALTTLLDKLGFHATKINGDDSYYLSPLRQEKKPSFHVNTKKNIWFDHGADQGGGILDFVCAYLQRCGEDHTVTDALRWLNNMMPAIYKVTPSARESFSVATSQLVLKEILPLQKKLLMTYLATRGIPQNLAKRYLKEVHVFNKLTGKEFFALGLRNEEKGYELRNEIFQGCVETKTITFIRGANPLSKDINVFEGFFDFLSALVIFKKDKMDGDCIILNSVSCLRQALPYINNYGYRTLYSWLDNDAAGKGAALVLDAFVKQQNELLHRPMNKLYAEHKDVNEWHLHKLNLPNQNDFCF